MLGLLTSLIPGGKVTLIMGLVIAGMAGAFYLYWNWSQDEIATLNQNNATLKAATQIQKETIQKLEIQKRVDQANLEELQTKNEETEKQANELRRILSKHDLEQLAKAKAGLIERVINKGTKEVIDNLRTLSDPNSIKNLSRVAPEVPVEDLGD